MAIFNERDDVPDGELFEIQDRIVTRVVNGIAPTVRAVELRRAMRKRPSSFTAYDHMLRGLHLLHGLDPDNQHRAYRCLQDAMEADPFYAMPFAWAAWWQVLAIGQAIVVDPSAAIESAGTLASHAIELDGANAMALAIYGHVKSYLFHQNDIGLQYLDRAVQAGPSNAWAWTFSALTLAYTDHGEQAVAHGLQALRLSPLDQNSFFLHSNLCLANYAKGDFAQAIRWGRIAQSENPGFSANYRQLAASLVAAGNFEQAHNMALRLLSLEPTFTLAKYRVTRQPFRDPAVADLFIARLSTAGLPD